VIELMPAEATPMRFLTLVKYDENGTPPPRAYLDALAEFNRTAMAAGAMIQCHGLQSSALGSRLRLSHTNVSTTDGPFTETKEVIGGFAVFDVPSKQDIMAWMQRFMELGKHWPDWQCEVEIRELLDQPKFG
jgi:hypothetical protein